MKMYPDHPLSTHFPLIEGDRFTALIDSITSVGLLHPITLFEEMVLDGRNRQRACLIAKVEPEYEIFEGTYVEAWEFVLERNLHDKQGRGDLSVTQRAMIVAEMCGFGSGSNQYARKLIEPKYHGESQDSAESQDSPLTQREAAKLAGVSQGMITRAVRILRDGKALLKDDYDKIINRLKEDNTTVGEIDSLLDAKEEAIKASQRLSFSLQDFVARLILTLHEDHLAKKLEELIEKIGLSQHDREDVLVKLVIKELEELAKRSLAHAEKLKSAPQRPTLSLVQRNVTNDF